MSTKAIYQFLSVIFICFLFTLVNEKWVIIRNSHTILIFFAILLIAIGFEILDGKKKN